jgi:hypothetical protein
MVHSFGLLIFMLSLSSSRDVQAAPPEEDAASDRLNATKDGSRTTKRDESVKVMRERATKTKLQFVEGDEDDTAVLNTQPLLYFTNEPHRIVGGSVWGWSSGGRPVAICKIEEYDRGRPDQTWLYCLASLSEKKIKVNWRDGESWAAKQAGLEIRDLPDGPPPAADERGRLRQMKELSRRFSANDFDPNGRGATQFRQLTQPLWRYSASDAGIVDGAVFATEGAGAVYLIELHKEEGSQPQWRYGVTAMSAWAVTIKLDEKEIWKKPFTAGPAPYENWIFRWERPVAGE